MTVYGKQRPIGNLAPERGELLAVRPAWITAAEYGPVSILAIWEATYDAPIYLVTNMVDLERHWPPIGNVRILKRSSRTRKVAAFTCRRVISAIPSA